MYYSYVEIKYVVTSFSPARMDLAVKLLIEHDLPYQPMDGDWHGLVEMAAKRHLHKQQCKAAGRCLSLLYKI
jgi:hypothetical protein